MTKVLEEALYLLRAQIKGEWQLDFSFLLLSLAQILDRFGDEILVREVDEISFLIQNPRIAQCDLLDISLDSFHPDEISDLERLREHEREASEKIRSSFLSCEGEQDSPDSCPRQDRLEIEPDQIQSREDPDAPYEDQEDVVDERRDLLSDIISPDQLLIRFREEEIYNLREHVDENDRTDHNDRFAQVVGVETSEAPSFDHCVLVSSYHDDKEQK